MRTYLKIFSTSTNLRRKKLTWKIHVQSLTSDENTKQMYYLIKYFKALYPPKSDRSCGFVVSP